MTKTKYLGVKTISGYRTSEDKTSILIGLTSAYGEQILSLSPKLATSLALTAIGAKNKFNNEIGCEAGQPEILEGFHCNKWEIRTSPDKKQILFSFRHISGVWIRLMAPLHVASAIKETLASIEGQTSFERISRDRQN